MRCNCCLVVGLFELSAVVVCLLCSLVPVELCAAWCILGDEPAIYRAVIDDVIANIKSGFDEYGVSEDVLAELQHVSMFHSFIVPSLAPFVTFPLTLEMGG